ncbi:MAG: translation initiation factor IF-2 subunit gamma [Candidatus Altiarchaeota archaeon]|nr:translation initiation factor IF-2 subunit gamma [Candidatus Altiarchaeota archaeon]
MVGHVDHGKTTLTQALSGKWTDTFSEELKRGISIKLGYANSDFYFDKSAGKPAGYNTQAKGDFLRCVSFVDSPGHEALMTIMLSASSIMDGALLLVAANEGIRGQTREHAMAAKIAGIKNLVVVQNKIDSVKKEEAIKNKQEIDTFLAKYEINAPVIPVSALHRTNIDLLIQTIEETIPTPKHNPKANPKFLVVRSFDVNKPGVVPSKMIGGVIGGGLVQGELAIGQEVEIRPGIKKSGDIEPIVTEITSLATGKLKLKAATPGGSIAIGTKLDPSLTKGDGLMGSVVGLPGKMPKIYESLRLKVELFDNVIGFEDKVIKVEPLRSGEPLVVNVNTTVTVGMVKSSGDTTELILKKPVCADKQDRIVLSRKVDGKWRLIGFGTIA